MSGFTKLQIVSGKEFKKRFLRYAGKHPYAWAEKNGIGKGVIARINKEKIPDINNLVKIANVLNVGIDRLIADGKQTGETETPSVSEKPEIHLAIAADNQESGLYVKKLLKILQCNQEGFRKNITSFVDVLYDLLVISQQQEKELARKRNEEDRLLKKIIDSLKNYPCHKEAVLAYVQQLIKHQKVLERIEKYKTNNEVKNKKTLMGNDQIDGLLHKIASKENAEVLLDIFEEIVKKSDVAAPFPKGMPNKD
ncbi:MAG: helix-turn-helix transcriptional regulator [Candidatus Kuenenia sp.]|nr:helix-turn-helix transcriptional regulator [Candidatus Kuenenia hertensis]